MQQRTVQEMDDEIQACDLQILQLKKARVEKLREELETQQLDKKHDQDLYQDNAAFNANQKKFETKAEIYRIFKLIEEKLRLNPRFVNQLSEPCQNDLTNLRTSITSFKRQLLKEVDSGSFDFPVRTAQKLQNAVYEVLNPTAPAYKKNAAVISFRNTARNAVLSHDTKVAIAAVAGGIIGLTLWVILTVATGGLAGLITFAGLGLGALIITFGAAHFAARSDSVMKRTNPHETRGSQVSYNLKALLRHREELKFAPSPHNATQDESNTRQQTSRSSVGLTLLTA